MMNELYDVICRLKATRSRNEKLEILDMARNVPHIDTFFRLALCPYTNFYMKKIPAYEPQNIGHSEYNWTSEFDYCVEQLELLSSRKVTGQDAIDMISNLLSYVRPENSELVKMILRKDPDCGVQDKTINSVFKGLVPTYNVMTCSAQDEKLINNLNWRRGVYVQLKADAARANIIIVNGGVTVRSRTGNVIETHGRFDFLSNVFPTENIVIDGELFARGDDGKILSRAIGNGIINKAIKGTISEDDAAKLALIAWDIIPYDKFLIGKYETEYDERMRLLWAATMRASVYTVASNSDKVAISIIPSEVVYSYEDAMKIYMKYRGYGEEGAILKDRDAIWENKRSKRQVKLKATIISTMRIVDYIEGKDRIEGLMGALTCESEDGKIRVNVGGGYSTKQRAQIAADYHDKEIKWTEIVDGAEVVHGEMPSGKSPIGMLIDVTHNGAIQAEDGSWSVFLSRATDGEYRLDKASADTFEEIISKL